MIILNTWLLFYGLGQEPSNIQLCTRGRSNQSHLDCSTFVAMAVGGVCRAQFGPTCYRVSCRRPILATTCPGQPSAYLWAYVAEIEGGAFDQSGSINWLPMEFVRNNLHCKRALRWCTMAMHFKGRAEVIKIWINLQTGHGEREEQLTMHKGDWRIVKMIKLARN